MATKTKLSPAAVLRNAQAKETAIKTEATPECSADEVECTHCGATGYAPEAVVAAARQLASDVVEKLSLQVSAAERQLDDLRGLLSEATDKLADAEHPLCKPCVGTGRVLQTDEERRAAVRLNIEGALVRRKKIAEAVERLRR